MLENFTALAMMCRSMRRARSPSAAHQLRRPLSSSDTSEEISIRSRSRKSRKSRAASPAALAPRLQAEGTVVGVAVVHVGCTVGFIQYQ